MRELEATVRKLENKVSKINRFLAILPPYVNPCLWKGLTPRDVRVLKFLISQEEGKQFTTTEIAEHIKEPNPKQNGRIRIHQSIERIRRISRRKRKTVLSHSAAKRRRKWAMNRLDFSFSLEVAKEKP